MKRIFALVMIMCVLMTSAAMAGTGTAIVPAETDPEMSAPLPTKEPAETLEIADWLGGSWEELKLQLEEYEDADVRMGEATDANGDKRIQKIIVREGNISVLGLVPLADFSEEQEALLLENGWEITAKNYEGGTLDWFLKKTVGEATYTLRFWDEMPGITYISLEVDNVDAHIEPLVLIPAETVEPVQE